MQKESLAHNGALAACDIVINAWSSLLAGMTQWPVLQAVREIATLSQDLSSLSVQLATSQSHSNRVEVSELDHQIEITSQKDRLSSLRSDIKALAGALGQAKDSEATTQSELEMAHCRLSAQQQEILELGKELESTLSLKLDAQEEVQHSLFSLAIPYLGCNF